MKKTQKIIVALALLVPIALLIYHKGSNGDETAQITIGIIQTASHPALDRARIGFINEMRGSLGDGIQFRYQNAEGIVSQAQSIAASYHGDSKVDAIYAIGTLAAQAIARLEKKKPIFIAAVSDPNKAGLIQPNLTGTSDKVAARKQIAMIKEIIPGAKSVALLYNPGEANSVAAIRDMAQAAKEAGLEYIEVGVQQASEVVATAKRAANKSDAILVPADNLLVAAMATVARIAIENKKPLFVTDPPSIEKGALACVGADYEQAGRQTARIAIRILTEKERPENIAIAEEDNPPLYLNQTTLNALKISISKSVTERAKVMP